MREGRLAEKRVLMGISQVSIASSVTVLTCYSPVYFSNITTCFPEEEVKLLSVGSLAKTVQPILLYFLSRSV